MREQIAEIITDVDVYDEKSTLRVADQILTFIKKRYVKLAKDQSLPDLNLPTLSGNRSLEITMTSFAKSVQRNMVKTGWRKVELGT